MNTQRFMLGTAATLAALMGSTALAQDALEARWQHSRGAVHGIELSSAGRLPPCASRAGVHTVGFRSHFPEQHGKLWCMHHHAIM